MKRHLIKLVTGLILIVIVGALVFTGCAKEEEPPPPPPPPPVEEEEEPPPPPPPVEEVWEWPEALTFITSPGVGVGAVTGYTSALTTDTGVKVRIVPENNTMLRFKWIGEGRFFVCSESLSIVSPVLEAARGNAIRDGGPYQIRAVSAFSSVDAGFFVRGDSDIYTPADIKPGTRFIEFSFAPGMFEVSPYGLINWAGLTPDDIVRVPAGSLGAAIRAVTDGRADICLSFPLMPDMMEAAASPHGIRWVDMNYDEDPEGAARFQVYQPLSPFGVMSQSPESMGVRGMVEIVANTTRAETDPELVYQFVKWLDENYDSFKDNHMWNQAITIDNLVKYMEFTFIPAHEGLVRYLKEKGLWTAAHDARQAQNIELLTRYIEAYQEAIDMADDAEIAVVPDNEEWVELWENYKQELGLPIFKVFTSLEE